MRECKRIRNTIFNHYEVLFRKGVEGNLTIPIHSRTFLLGNIKPRGDVRIEVKLGRILRITRRPVITIFYVIIFSRLVPKIEATS